MESDKKRTWLRDVEIFAHVEPATLQAVAAALEERALSASEFLCRENILMPAGRAGRPAG